MATNLENIGKEKRAGDNLHALYNNANQYSEFNPNAISNGTMRGKGDTNTTGVGVVDRTKGVNVIDRSTISVYDNDDFTGIGNSADIASRRNMITQYAHYSKLNPYSEDHEDALSTGTMRGKGTNSQLPDYTRPGSPNIGYFRSIDTEGGGNSIDVSTREKHIAGNVYSAANPYGDVTISDEIENMANINTYYLS